MKPRSSADETSGVRYFPRMLDKIRLHSKGQLDPDYHPNLGAGADGRLTKFLRISYDDLRQRVGQGGTDEEILEWCFTNGRRLDGTIARSGTVLSRSLVGTISVQITWLRLRIPAA